MKKDMGHQFFKMFWAGMLAGLLLAPAAGYVAYKEINNKTVSRVLGKIGKLVPKIKLPSFSGYRTVLIEDFREAVTVEAGRSFGKKSHLTFETFRNGTFVINGKSGFAEQRSPSYRDSAFIRSTDPLPKRYKVSVVVGDIQYPLEALKGLKNDPEYPEGPQNENGCYLLTITDTKPSNHHTNIWWHQHRKMVIDVDNNIWGHGAPNPIFMVHFNRDNRLVAYNGNQWEKNWVKAVTYKPQEWYKVEIERTDSKYILTVAKEGGEVLAQAEVPHKDVWRGDSPEEYFVVGDPHENYYQGSMRIKSITVAY